MIGFAYQRIRAGLPMPGVIEVFDNVPNSEVINDLEVIIGAGQPEDFENIVTYVPLR